MCKVLVAAVTYEAVSSSGRILLYSWSLLSLVMIASYTSKLTSNSVLTRQPLPFNSLSELVKRTDYRWAFSEAIYLETIFAVSLNVFTMKHVCLVLWGYSCNNALMLEMYISNLFALPPGGGRGGDAIADANKLRNKCKPIRAGNKKSKIRGNQLQRLCRIKL